MVPDEKKMDIDSMIDTYHNVICDLIDISEKKQQFITNLQWDMLSISSEQEVYAKYTLDELEKNIDNLSKELDIKKLISDKNKIKIRESLDKYREIESINVKLLNNSIEVAKKRVSDLLSDKGIDNTYTKELTREINLWENRSVLVDQRI